MFIPWIHNGPDFMQACTYASIVLDPFHFGIGTTGSIVFSVGTPIVTLPGEFLRGRVGFAYAKMLNLPECIATSADDYVQRAIEIATNPELRASLSRRIAENRHLLFQPRNNTMELRDFLINAAKVTQSGATS